MTEVKGFLAILSAAILCPCHLPLFAGLLAGTALGGAIVENSGLVITAMGIYFLGAVFLGVRWLTRERSPACDVCEPMEPTRGAMIRARDELPANRAEPMEVKG